MESWPVETGLDHADLPDAPEVWRAMIDGAERSLDFLEFYAATEPDGRLEPVLAAIERAAARGVRVRFVFDAAFHARMPEIPDRLAAIEGVEVRVYDFGARGGGVQHAKLFVVDGAEAFVGSQNFDWRSLTHIQELGLRVSHPALVAAVADLFAFDWALAGGASLQEARAALPDRPSRFPVAARFAGAPVRVTPVASPRGWLPDEARWEWPAIREALEGARARIRIQVMSYHLRGHEGDEWRALDEALRAAAARGVRVSLIVSHWDQRPERAADLQALQRVDGIEVRFVTIPPASSGFIPFARTIHAKYLTVDGDWAWIGSSNASGDYFLRSRNAGFVVEGAPFAARLDAFFDDLWSGPHAEPVDPARAYEAPRVAE
ncbi:MAG TPA: phospholipase D-like domain-containing protein [Sandaracinaceae bacterium LLY-WYZ-13_1]|nr:phospholipase D-like domain-containing protein [Sandaracinaceae bacterium LLY-WYZ-13_1]